MRSWRLTGSLLLTGVALIAAAFWIRVVVPRSETTEAPLVQADLSPAPESHGIRLVIPSIGVDAPVVSAGRDAAGNMAAPEGPKEVAWYDFTPRPGHRGNAVLAGHLNWRDGTVAVFAHLAKLKQGDSIDYIDEAGQALHYRVVSIEDVDAFTTDVSKVINWTASESLTLITCSGQFVWTAQSFSTRTVVRAERVPSTQS